MIPSMQSNYFYLIELMSCIKVNHNSYFPCAKIQAHRRILAKVLDWYCRPKQSMTNEITDNIMAITDAHPKRLQNIVLSRIALSKWNKYFCVMNFQHYIDVYYWELFFKLWIGNTRLDITDARLRYIKVHPTNNTTNFGFTPRWVFSSNTVCIVIIL